MQARQLNVAEWQHILFHEWLPALLGSLAPAPRTPLLSYDAALTPAVSLEVSSIVIPAFVDTLTPAAYGDIAWAAQYGVSNVLALLQVCARPLCVWCLRTPHRACAQHTQDEGIDPMLRRLIQTHALAFDDRVINALRNIVNGTQDIDYVVRHLQRTRIIRTPDWAGTYTCERFDAKNNQMELTV